MKEKMLKAIYLHDGKFDCLDFEDDLKVMYSLLDCETIDIVERKINGKFYDIIIDDEGLLRGKQAMPAHAMSEEFTDMFTGQITREKLYGNLLIVRHDGHGNFKSLTDEDIDRIRQMVRERPLGWQCIVDYKFE